MCSDAIFDIIFSKMTNSLNSNSVKEIDGPIATKNGVDPGEYVEISVTFARTYAEKPRVIIAPIMNGESFESSSRIGCNFSYAIYDTSTTGCKVIALNISDIYSYPYFNVFVL